jgi:hypothetical protein
VGEYEFNFDEEGFLVTTERHVVQVEADDPEEEADMAYAKADELADKVCEEMGFFQYEVALTDAR